MAATSAAVLALASCEDEGGKALPGGPNTPPSSAPSSAPGQGGGELEKIQACDLLTEQEAATISEGLKAEDLGPRSGSSDSCSWETNGDDVSIDKYVVFGIDIRPGQTVDDYFVSTTGKVTDGKVGEGRKAKQVAENGGKGSCELTFATENGRVDIGVSIKDTERACEIASDVSTLIEPKLPEPTG